MWLGGRGGCYFFNQGTFFLTRGEIKRNRTARGAGQGCGVVVVPGGGGGAAACAD